MTRDEHRAQCIEAMARTMCCQYYISLQGVIRFGTTEVLAAGVNRDVEEHWREWHDKATEVLDSLHGIAFVDPIEATEEMIAAGVHAAHPENCREVYAAIAARGDLTNQPEEKP